MQSNNDFQPPVQKTSPYVVLLVVGIGTFLSAMAGSAINLTLPVMSFEMGISLNLAGWVINAFLLAVTVLLLAAGRAGDLFGHRKIYLIGFFLFGAASFLCGIAPGIGSLIAARVFQGIGGAMVMATGPALLTTTFPGAQRGKALGILASATYIGLTIGPPLGGILIGTLGWRWVYFINIPVTVVVLGIGLYCLPRYERLKRTKVDYPGAITMLLGLPMLLVAISQGHDWGWLSPGTVLCIIGGTILMAAFFIIEKNSASPLLHLDIFSSKLFTGSALAAVFNYIALFFQIILLPFYLIQGLEIDATHAGIILSAQPLVMAVVASPAGWLSDKIGYRLLTVSGMMILAGGLIGLATIGSETSVSTVMLWLAVMGLGTGIFISPNSSALMGSAPKNRQGIAGGVLAVARNFGMMVGVAFATLTFQAAGGVIARFWQPGEFEALSVAFCVAAGFAFLSAIASAFRGNSTNHQ